MYAIAYCTPLHVLYCTVQYMSSYVLVRFWEEQYNFHIHVLYVCSTYVHYIVLVTISFTNYQSWTKFVSLFFVLGIELSASKPDKFEIGHKTSFLLTLSGVRYCACCCIYTCNYQYNCELYKHDENRPGRKALKVNSTVTN